jgi:hypothetical protein
MKASATDSSMSTAKDDDDAESTLLTLRLDTAISMIRRLASCADGLDLG